MGIMYIDMYIYIHTHIYIIIIKLIIYYAKVEHDHELCLQDKNNVTVYLYEAMVFTLHKVKSTKYSKNSCESMATMKRCKDDTNRDGRWK